MTTLASNASAENPARGQAAAAQTATADAVTPKPHSPAETTLPTLASRLIIFALCLAVVLSTLAFGTVHSWSLAVFHAGAMLILVAWLADAWKTRRLRLSRNVLQLPLLGLFTLGLVQLLPLGSPDTATTNALPVPAVHTLSFAPYATRFVLIQLSALFIYFAAALAFVDTPRRLRAVVRTIIIFGFALAVVSMMLSFVSPDKVLGLRQTRQSLSFGPFINRHHFAGYMELTLALPLGLLFSGAVERERRVLYILAAALMGIAIILTNSRGGMLSLVLEIMFMVMVAGVGRGKRGDGGSSRSRERKQSGRKSGTEDRTQSSKQRNAEDSRVRRLARRAALGFVIVLALFTGVLFFGGESALNRLVGTVSAEDPTTGRVHFWRGTLGIIRDHPLIGTGLGSFAFVYTRYDLSNGKVFRLEQAHNDYLQTLSDAGVVGGVLGLFFIVALFRTGFQRMESSSTFRRGVALGALAGCFAVLVHSFFDFTLHTTANALLFLMLAALATLNGRVEHTHRRRPHTAHDGAHAPTPTTTPTSAPVAAGSGAEGDTATAQAATQD